jgi:hypothetical protein
MNEEIVSPEKLLELAQAYGREYEADPRGVRKLVGIKGEYECRNEQECSARIVASWGNAS